MWERIYREWLPVSDYELIPDFDIENYLPGDPSSKNSVFLSGKTKIIYTEKILDYYLIIKFLLRRIVKILSFRSSLVCLLLYVLLQNILTLFSELYENKVSFNLFCNF